MDVEEKVRENRLRRMAKRQGLEVQKSRARDPRAISYQGYMIRDVFTNIVVAGATPYEYTMTMDDVEGYLTGEDA